MLSKIPGYRRSLRYQLGKDDFAKRTPKDAPRFIAIHEFDDLSGLDGPELKAADTSAWTKKVLSKSTAIVARGFRLVQPFGY